MITLISLVSTAYLLVMLYFAWGFNKVNTKISPNYNTPKVPFTVIIPFRNETANLPSLIQSLQAQQENAATEILFINDNSQDDSFDLIQNILNDFPMGYRVLQNEGEGKKAALLTGINASKTEWLVTTDSDVILPETWMRELSAQISNTNAQMLVMPIMLKSDKGIFQDLQKLESAALVGMSAGALMNGKALTANGANLAFTKTIFREAGGYLPENNTPSGDDEFLLKRVHAMNASHVELCFSKKLIVEAAICKNFKELINQRTRWASKIEIKGVKWTQLFVLIPSLFMALLSIFLVISLIGFHKNIFASLLLSKWMADFFLFFVIKNFFGLSYNWIGTLILLPFYQIIYMLPVLFNKFFASFEWKGRRYGA